MRGAAAPRRRSFASPGSSRARSAKAENHWEALDSAPFDFPDRSINIPSTATPRDDDEKALRMHVELRWHRPPFSAGAIRSRASSAMRLDISRSANPEYLVSDWRRVGRSLDAAGVGVLRWR